MISAAFAVHAAFGGDYPYSSAALTNVTVTGGFWLPRFETNRLVTLKADIEKCELERIYFLSRSVSHFRGRVHLALSDSFDAHVRRARPFWSPRRVRFFNTPRKGQNDEN